jgi:general secretion pathway protein K
MSSQRQGFALLIVLLTMAFLALLGSRLMAAARSDTRIADSLKQDAVLEAAADGAVAHVMFATQAAQDPQFQPDGPPHVLRIGQTPVVVRIENERDRVDLNKASIALLRALITEAGVPKAQADQLAGAIIDWRTTGPASQDGGPKAPRYQAAGLDYTPPGTPFKSIQELTDILGMTPALFERLAPHLTVMTGTDPDFATHDPVVARALADVADATNPAGIVAGVMNPAGVPRQTVGDVLRIIATATGTDGARYCVTVVASSDFQHAAPRVTILSHEHIIADRTGMALADAR